MGARLNMKIHGVVNSNSERTYLVLNDVRYMEFDVCNFTGKSNLTELIY